MQQQNLYSILGVKKTATLKEIKTAYRTLAKKHHPDKHFGNSKAEEHFKEIQRAYAVLSDIYKRQEYDLKLGGANLVSASGGYAPYMKYYQRASNQTTEYSDFASYSKDKKSGINLFPLIISVVVALIFIFFIMMYKV